MRVRTGTGDPLVYEQGFPIGHSPRLDCPKSQKKVIDFTRYDLEAQESVDPEPGKPIRNWSLMNRLNQKGIRPQDVPIKIGKLSPNE